VSVLRENLANCIEAFQTLLKEHRNDGTLIDAVKKRWKDDHHVCRVLVMACQTSDSKGFPDPPGVPSSDDDDNILTNKNPEIKVDIM
jgi:hypothetical protein